jgi:eukaryotic-like serine/threonine-protein kinase
VVDRYSMGKRIGSGGFGDVYRAVDLLADHRPCAIKIFRPEAVKGMKIVLTNQLVALLDSPHTVSIFDVGKLADGRPFVAMELLDQGRTLADALRDGGRLGAREAARILDGILAAVETAHAKGLAHRDLKPANVFLVDLPNGGLLPKVLDFDIAALVHKQTDGMDEIMGTPSFMPPEQFEGGQPDFRGDLYAAGATLFTMVAGRPPFVAEDPVPEQLGSAAPQRLAWLHRHQAVPPLPHSSPELAGLCARLLAKAPANRPRTAAAARAELRRTPEMAAAPSPPPRAVAPELEVPPWLQIVGVGVALALGATAAGWLLSAQRGPVRTTVVRAQAPVVAPSVAGDEPRTCRRLVESTPPGARVTLRGRRLGLTPILVTRPCDKPWAVELAYPGYAPQRRTLDADYDAPPIRVVLQLEGRGDGAHGP